MIVYRRIMSSPDLSQVSYKGLPWQERKTQSGELARRKGTAHLHQLTFHNTTPYQRRSTPSRTPYCSYTLPSTPSTQSASRGAQYGVYMLWCLSEGFREVTSICVPSFRPPIS